MINLIAMLMILAVFSIFFGFITKDIFIGLGSGFFSDNALFIHPSHEIMLDTEFGVPTLFKLLPLIFTISLSVMAIVLSEYLSTILIYFKLSRVGYNIFSFFNQRFLIELFYNRYITGIILKLGGQTTKVIDKGSVEYLGPYGLEKGLLNISNNIARLNTGVITSYALYILIGLITYLLFNSYINSSNIILVLLISLSLALFGTYKHNAHILTSSLQVRRLSISYKMKKTLITILFFTIVTYIIRCLFIYCTCIDILSIEEHPVISFFSAFGLNGLRVIIKGLVELYYTDPAMISSGNPLAPVGNLAMNSSGNPTAPNPPALTDPSSGNPTAPNPPALTDPSLELRNKISKTEEKIKYSDEQHLAATIDLNEVLAREAYHTQNGTKDE
jgi:hypothetical protein